MDAREISLSDIFYRIFSNRRILAISVLFAVIGVAISAQIGGPTSLFSDRVVAFTAISGWSAFMVFLLVRFPNGWMDPPALSLALVPFVAAVPFYEHLLSMLALDQIVIGTIWLSIGATIGWIFSYLGTIYVFVTLSPKIKLGQRRAKSSVTSELPARVVFDSIVRGPNHDCETYSSGSPGKAGFFPVKIKAIVPDPDRAKLGDWTSTYQMKILEKGDLSQTSLIAAQHVDGTITTSVQIETCQDIGNTSIYTSEEMHDHFDLASAMSWWLRDFGADYLVAVFDDLQSKRPRANRLAHYDTILTMFARKIEHLNCDDHHRL